MGLSVAEVQRGSEAYGNGIWPGDVIAEAGGVRIGTVFDFLTRVKGAIGFGDTHIYLVLKKPHGALHTALVLPKALFPDAPGWLESPAGQPGCATLQRGRHKGWRFARYRRIDPTFYITVDTASFVRLPNWEIVVSNDAGQSVALPAAAFVFGADGVVSGQLDVQEVDALLDVIGSPNCVFGVSPRWSLGRGLEASCIHGTRVYKLSRNDARCDRAGLSPGPAGLAISYPPNGGCRCKASSRKAVPHHCLAGAEKSPGHRMIV